MVKQTKHASITYKFVWPTYAECVFGGRAGERTKTPLCVCSLILPVDVNPSPDHGRKLPRATLLTRCSTPHVEVHVNTYVHVNTPAAVRCVARAHDQFRAVAGIFAGRVPFQNAATFKYTPPKWRTLYADYHLQRERCRFRSIPPVVRAKNRPPNAQQPSKTTTSIYYHLIGVGNTFQTDERPQRPPPLFHLRSIHLSAFALTTLSRKILAVSRAVQLPVTRTRQIRRCIRNPTTRKQTPRSSRTAPLRVEWSNARAG